LRARNLDSVNKFRCWRISSNLAIGRRRNLRSVFTNQSQARPFDEICDMLLKRCHSSDSTDWTAIAHVLPDADVLKNVSAAPAAHNCQLPLTSTPQRLQMHWSCLIPPAQFATSKGVGSPVTCQRMYYRALGETLSTSSNFLGSMSTDR
jgi:hypothetical protein